MIFQEEDNFHYFLRLAKKYIYPIADIYAYALLPDHFHFLVRIKEEHFLIQHKITSAKAILLKFGHWFNAYAKAYNKRYNQVSSLFEDRFERVMVSNNAFLFRLFSYIHWNPEKHKYVADFQDWPYLSYHSLLSDELTILAREVVLDIFGGNELFIEFHKKGIDDL